MSKARAGLSLAVTVYGAGLFACSSTSADSAGLDGNVVDSALTDAPADGRGDLDASPEAATLIEADASSDAGICSPPRVLRYESAGCGAEAHPVCGRPDQDACAAPVCGCDGTTLSKCDYAAGPWSHAGSCSGAADP